MSQNQKSGQKIKAKISKIPLSFLNTLPMTEISPAKIDATLLPNRHSAPVFSQTLIQSPQQKERKENESGPAPCSITEQKLETLKLFGIPDNFGCHIKIKDEYSHNLCKDRVSSFKDNHNLDLDVRDERVNLPLNCNYLQTFLQGGCKGDMEPLLDEIRDWLIDLVEITCSVSFNLLKKGNLGEKEAKNFASKNMLLNVKNMFQTLNDITFAQRFGIMQFVNSNLQKIIENIILKYPQSSSKGASRRIKNKVRRIDNREDDQYDFLYRNSISIPYRKSGDYSEEVMKVINKLVSLAGDSFHPDCQQTNFEVFTQIMEYMFENCSSQQPSNTAEDVVELIAIKTRSKGENFILSSTNITELREALSFSDRVDKKNSSSRDLSNKDYLIGQKIPIGTPQFSQKQLEGGSFRVHDSSVLRILTKWAQELRQKVVNAEQAISKRVHKFKLKSGKFMNLQSNMKEKLYFAAQQDMVKLHAYMEYLNKENNAMQSYFAEQTNIGKHGKHDTKVGIFAAKMNQIASQYMFKYVNRLIHALLLIPRAAASGLTNQTQKNMLNSVDLVTLKIGDLMRSKYCCSQQEFLKMLSILEELDCKHPEILRIVRIKNRLQQKDNDVLINLYFMSRVECELQLSIRGLHSQAEHQLSAFNHFLYEIIRSKLGPLSQMANIVTQYDPLIHHFKRMKQYGPQLLQQAWLKDKKKLILDKLYQRLKFKRDYEVSKSVQLPFLCYKCFHLAIVNNPNLYVKKKKDPKLFCNNCKFDDIIQNPSKQCEGLTYLMGQSFKDEYLRDFLHKHIDYWDLEKQLREMEEQGGEDQCKVLNLPMKGYFLKKHSKLPKMMLYSAVFDPVYNSYILMTVNQKGMKKQIAKIPLYLQKKKRIETFKKELQNFYFFKYTDTVNRIESGKLYLSCAKEGCCGKEVKAGPLLTSSQITEISHIDKIKQQLCHQKSLMNLNSIPLALQRVQETLNQIDDPSRIEKITRSTHNIKAINCSLQNIQIVSRFTNLTDINISENRILGSLKGIQQCTKLKNLQCKNCGLESIDQLARLKKLEYLNLKGNPKLASIAALKNHKQLMDLNIAHTEVASLEPLQNCLKLQSLNIEDCHLIKSLSPINSSKLSYLNMVDCNGIEEFDLNLNSLKSLKSVQYDYAKVSKQKMGFELILTTLDYLEEDKDGKEAEETDSSIVDIQKINQMLKFNRQKDKPSLFRFI